MDVEDSTSGDDSELSVSPPVNTPLNDKASSSSSSSSGAQLTRAHTSSYRSGQQNTIQKKPAFSLQMSVVGREVYLKKLTEALKDNTVETLVPPPPASVLPGSSSSGSTSHSSSPSSNLPPPPPFLPKEFYDAFENNFSVKHVKIGDGSDEKVVESLVQILIEKKKDKILSLGITFTKVDVWKHVFRFIKDNKVLQSLDFSGSNLADNDMEGLVEAILASPKIEALNLRGCLLSETGIEHLKKLAPSSGIPTSATISASSSSHLSSSPQSSSTTPSPSPSSSPSTSASSLPPVVVLKNLNLGNFQKFENFIISATISTLLKKTLVELNLADTKLDAIGSKIIEALAEANNIKKIDLSNTALNDAAFLLLSRMIKIKSFTNLRLSRLKISQNSAHALGDALLVNKSITDLDVSNVDCTPQATKALIQGISENTFLKIINLNEVEVDVKAVANMIKLSDALVSISIRGCGISFIDPILDEWLKKKQQLEFFEYGGNFLGGKIGTKLQTILSDNYKLAHLGLGYCPDLTNEVVRPLIQTLQEDNKSLTSLDISGLKFSEKFPQKCIASIGVLLQHSRGLKTLKLDDTGSTSAISVMLSDAVCEGLFLNEHLTYLSMKNCSVSQDGKPFLWALNYHPMEFLDLSGVEGPSEFVEKDVKAVLGGTLRTTSSQIVTMVPQELSEVANLLSFAYMRNPRYMYITPFEKRQNFLADIFSTITSYISGNGEIQLRKDTVDGGVPRITSVACWLNSDHPLNFPQSEMLKKSFTTLMSAGLNQAAKLRSMTSELEKFWNKTCPPTSNKLLYFGAHPYLMTKNTHKLTPQTFFGTKFDEIAKKKGKIWTYATEPQMLSFWKELGFVIDCQMALGKRLQVWSLTWEIKDIKQS